MNFELTRADANVIVSSLKSEIGTLERAIESCMGDAERWENYLKRPEHDPREAERWEFLKDHASKMQAKVAKMKSIIFTLESTKREKQPA